MEAELGFIGATHNSPAISGLLVDIGGGSTEIVYYENKNIVSEISLPIGSLNFKTRFVKGLFPVAEEIDEMYDEVSEGLGYLKFPYYNLVHRTGTSSEFHYTDSQIDRFLSAIAYRLQLNKHFYSYYPLKYLL